MSAMETGKPAFEEYLHRLSGQEKELDLIGVDHNYSKCWSSHPDSHHSKPAKLLFMKLRHHQQQEIIAPDLIIDVEDVDPSPVVPPYDNQKTRAMMNECDQFLRTSLDHEPEELEQLNRNGWSLTQKSLHKQMMKILQSSHLSKLASSGSSTELVKRKIMIEKSARRVRKLFTSYTWDMTLLCWLHQTLMDSLSAPILSEYFEILRSLKAKVPNLIDKLLTRVTSFHNGIFGNCSTEAFSQLLRKPWDPVLSCMTQNKPRKVGGNPLIVVVPSAPNQTIANQSQRMKFIWNQMGSLGKVIHSTVHSSGNMAVGECLDQIFTSTRGKVAELKNQHPSRPIILAGWTIGALLACHIALEETVAAVVCLGFPLKGVQGSRGDLDDPLLDSKIPTLFLIGQNSCSCSMDDMEDFRERMRAETGLVVVGGADEMLRISVTKKKTEGITQSMVDRCLVDEIGDFLNSIVNQPNASQSTVNKRPRTTATPTIHLHHQQHVQQQQLQSHVVDEAKRQRRRPREYSPDFSPVRKKPKPTSTYQPVRKVSASSSSDTSSTGSYAQERASKRDKKSSRKSGRSSFNLGKRRRIPKIVRGGLKMKLQVNPSSARKEANSKPTESPTSAAKLPSPQKIPMASSRVLSVGESAKTPLLPPPPVVSSPPMCKKPPLLDVPRSLSLANQHKSNGPVDVEKAFGRDSSFLPRPLTPAEMDDSVTESNLNQSNHSSSFLNAAPNAGAEIPATEIVVTPVTVAGTLAAASSSPPEKKKVTFLTTNSESFPLVTFSAAVGPTTIAMQTPQVATEPLLFEEGSAARTIHQQIATELTPASAELLTLSKGPATVIPQQPTILSSGGLTIKQLQNTITSLAGRNLVTSPMGVSVSKPQTILVSPSTSINKPTTFLMTSGPDVGPKKIQVRRMVVKPAASQLSPSRLSVPIMAKLNPIATTIPGQQPSTGEPVEAKTCNLSLLSDVAGMKEPIRQVTVTQEFLPASSGATLVKLTSDHFSADKRTVSAAATPPMRRFRLIEAIPPSTAQPSPCLDTPEEFAEKQMAIQALSSSLNEGTDESTTSGDVGLTIGYNTQQQRHKPASVRQGTRPYSVLGYPVVMPQPRDAQILGTRIPYRGRGRGMNPFGPAPRKPRIQRFYPF